MKILGQLLAATAVASMGLAAACKSEETLPDSPAATETTATPGPNAGTPAPDSGETGVPDGEPIDSGTIGGDGSELRVATLTAAQISSADLQGELSCSFIRSDERAPLLLASGNVGSDDRALGVVGYAGGVERIMSTEDGGFDAIVDGGRFATKGLTIDVRRGKAPMPGATGESPPYPAAMRLMRADGAERSFNGTWNCGP
ncbi:hypothetical protein [Croceicoccus naphthovorans]|uniref:Uncharacterized protein n=1 Tax=Croceicoccus naphthovorans TaxID=1348774 RepID=A0A0G3XJY5_9SPHN|nr:hypothetical protein [Croceicoccus naphthovorans]AKM10904.1 hypothetical protein AB433_14525 [Croceicoccus naphthovorans]MBB3989144.1 hypothetical protein [Croceicoccus naphthovorans]